MRIGIISRNPRSWSAQQLDRAFRDEGVEPIFFRFRDFVALIGFGAKVIAKEYDVLEDLNALLVRPIGKGSLEEIIFRMDMLHKLAREGFPVINHPSTIEKCVDKYYALVLLEENGLPVPKTVVTESINKALKLMERLGPEVVLKPLFGSRGHGITKLIDIDASRTIFMGLRLVKSVIYLQEFIPHGTRDIRVFVIGDRVVAAMYRESDTWKTNVAQGARPKPLKPNKEIEELALKAAAVLGCEIAGIDMMEGPEGLVISEVNSQPGWRGIQTVTKVDIAKEMAKYVIRRAKL
ncbi:MAG TPA: RimK family alpha-L-glutamate ligase [Candidatus Korarchaeota archaeon]|nr:RimK family alpha-L-glutamate ligase [Candidatus Korarchaeota archaeon]